MRKNIARVLLYAACAVLVVFYILVLWWGKNPKVGTEYLSLIHISIYTSVRIVCKEHSIQLTAAELIMKI